MEKHTLEDFAAGVYAEVPEVIQELLARIPYGEKITLSNGRTMTFEKLSGKAKIGEDGNWRFMLDARFEKGPGPDHIEFTVTHTGGGGFVATDGSLTCQPASAPSHKEQGE